MKNFILFILIFSCASLKAQTIDSAWFVTHYSKKEMYIPMRDGIKLFTCVYAPVDSSEKHPILFLRTPYSCAPYGETKYIKYWKKLYGCLS